MKTFVATLIVAFLFLASCSPRLHFQQELMKMENEFQDHIGFILYDPVTKTTLLEYNAGKYFTPASNTKIFTLFTGLQLLGDSVPAFRYMQRGDSLIFWGTGDPSFLYSAVFQNGRTYDFLKGTTHNLYFSSSNLHAQHFGPGWAWDDYNAAYSPERTSFPLYGNLVTFSPEANGQVKATPPYFKNMVVPGNGSSARQKVTRAPWINEFAYHTNGDTLQQQVPFRTNAQLIVTLLSDTLNKAVTMVDYPMPSQAAVFYGLPSDSLYKPMMQESDNFIAEQLLLVCAGMVSDSLASEIAIDYVKEKFLFDLPDKPIWVDGSGLSRYNLFTPRTIVRLWEKILTLTPREKLFPLLATGGKAGTIKNNYKAETPYIFGKTGTLSNNHSLSGYLVSKKGKILIFSFMNNNYAVSATQVREAMEKILRTAYDQY